MSSLFWLQVNKVLESFTVQQDSRVSSRPRRSERLALPLEEGHRVVPGRRAFLPLHLHLRLRRELQLDGAGVHLGGAQEPLHALHLLALEDHHGTARTPAAAAALLLGGGGRLRRRRVRQRRAGGRLGLAVRVDATPPLVGRAAATPDLRRHLLGRRCGQGAGRRRGPRGGQGGQALLRLLLLLLQLGLAPRAPPSALAGVIAGLVVLVLGLGLLGDDGHLLPDLVRGGGRMYN